VIGVPVVPPASVATAAFRFRQALGRAHRAMVPPPVQIRESLFGILDWGALVALHELGVADALTGATTTDALAARLGVAADPLDRLLRYSASRGWLRVDRRGRFRPNAVTRFLRTDHPGGWSAWVDLVAGDDAVAAVRALAGAVRSGDEAFVAANGASFFDWMTRHPARARAFDGAMAAGARMHGIVLAAALDWSSTRRVCDVGGGDGSLLRTLLGEQPHLRGVLLDLPDVTARAPAVERFEIVPGDAFEQVPAGCDTYLFVNVIHDWGDGDAVRLMARAAAAGSAGVRIVVVEGHRSTPPADDITTRSDLLMLALAPGGRERTAGELGRLGERAGLRLQRVVPLASADFAHVFVR
jgi:hypothetical protein